ncbi:MAG: hypothetical protein JW969_12670, partial [Spirochaetales bacterium]|nr:hypothetical protein [Spirochaetales bacterium]
EKKSNRIYPRLRTVGQAPATPRPDSAQAVPTPGDSTIKLSKEEEKSTLPGELNRYKKTSILLQNQNKPDILPEDYKIGSIQNLNTGNPEKKSILSSAEIFLKSLVNGKVPVKSIKEDQLFRIKYILQQIIDNKDSPVKYRIGFITNDYSDKIMLHVRLWGTVRSTECELYMTRVNNKWVVSDFIADLSGLNSQGGSTKREKFIPDTFQTGLSP